MPTAHYPAIVERAGDGYSIFFPDVPGCVTTAATIDAVAIAAGEALSGHLRLIVDHNMRAPDATPLAELGQQPHAAEITRLLIRADYPGRSIKVELMLEADLLARIDRLTPDRAWFLATAAAAALAAR